MLATRHRESVHSEAFCPCLTVRDEILNCADNQDTRPLDRDTPIRRSADMISHETTNEQHLVGSSVGLLFVSDHSQVVKVSDRQAFP